MHVILAFSLNLFVLVSADHEFQLMRPTQFSQVVLFVGSLLTSYYYSTSAKTYDVFNFEAAFERLGGEAN